MRIAVNLLALTFGLVLGGTLVSIAAMYL